MPDKEGMTPVALAAVKGFANILDIMFQMHTGSTGM